MTWMQPRPSLIIAIGLALAAAFGLAGESRAQGPNPGPAERDQVDPVLADGYAGGQLLAWTEDTGSRHRVMAKRIFSNGLPVGGDSGGAWQLTGRVAGGTVPGDQRWPALGEGLVLWSEKLDGAADYDIYGQRIAANGRSYGHPKLMVERPGNQSHPSFVSNGRELLVVWSEDSDDAGDIYGQRFSASALSPRGEAFEIAKEAGASEEPIIVPDPTEGQYYLVLWTDDRNGNKDIFGTRVVPTGLPRGGSTGGHFAVVETPENDYAPAAIISEDPLPQQRREDSRSLLLWVHEDPTDGPDVMAQRLRLSGFAYGTAMSIAGGPGVQTTPSVSLGNDRDWFVIWSGANTPPTTGGGSLDVYQIDVRISGHLRQPLRRLAAD